MRPWVSKINENSIQETAKAARRPLSEAGRPLAEHVGGKSEPWLSMLEAKGVLRGCKVVPAPARLGPGPAKLA